MGNKFCFRDDIKVGVFPFKINPKAAFCGFNHSRSLMVVWALVKNGGFGGLICFSLFPYSNMSGVIGLSHIQSCNINRPKTDDLASYRPL